MTKKEPEAKVITILDPESVTLKEKKRCPMSGSKNDDFSDALCNQVVTSIWYDSTDEKYIHKRKLASLIGIIGASPRDEIEGMLSAQMVAAHNATMECFKRAMVPDQSVNSRDYNLNHAGKLMRAYAGMMEALNRYRGKGQQKMTVEHVHVHAGGQAIVGNVTRPEGGGAAKKR